MEGYILILCIIHIIDRLPIAALHFNENFGREQAKTLAGWEQIRIVFPKQKQGEFTPKPISVPKTYSKYISIKFMNCLILMNIFWRLC